MDDMNAKCSECGNGFHCASLDNYQDKSNECWCKSLPAILLVESKTGCLCSNCLKQRIVESLPDYLRSIGHDKCIALAKHYLLDSKPEEGIDYQMEQGLLVFSAWYHLKRGYCCGNGCRHCPYPKA